MGRLITHCRWLPVVYPEPMSHPLFNHLFDPFSLELAVLRADLFGDALGFFFVGQDDGLLLAVLAYEQPPFVSVGVEPDDSGREFSSHRRSSFRLRRREVL